LLKTYARGLTFRVEHLKGFPSLSLKTNWHAAIKENWLKNITK
jgi:hypothetical protein